MNVRCAHVNNSNTLCCMSAYTFTCIRFIPFHFYLFFCYTALFLLPSFPTYFYILKIFDSQCEVRTVNKWIYRRALRLYISINRIVVEQCEQKSTLIYIYMPTCLYVFTVYYGWCFRLLRAHNYCMPIHIKYSHNNFFQ